MKQRNRLQFLLAFIMGLLALAVVVSVYMATRRPSSYGSEQEQTDQWPKPGEAISAEIPVLEYRNEDGQKRPLIILLHGLTGKKEDMASLARSLADIGFFVVTPDAYGHGERLTDTPVSVIQLAINTALDLDLLVEGYQDSPYADTSNYGVVGFSLGGLAAYYHAANGKTCPAAVVAFCATPYWEELVGAGAFYDVYSKRGLTPISTQSEKDDITALLLTHSPFAALTNSERTSLLMINGAKDNLMPSEGCQKLYDALSSKRENVEFILNPAIGHDMDMDDLVYAVNFLQENLALAR